MLHTMLQCLHLQLESALRCLLLGYTPTQELLSRAELFKPMLCCSVMHCNIPFGIKEEVKAAACLTPSGPDSS